MKKVVIVIPVHKENPSEYELISFRQCFKVLGKHPIKIIAPESLNVSAYKRAVPDFEVLYIDPRWQSTLFNYNKLKRSLYFYNLFKSYEYLLTYELDAFVFRDELLEWCDKGYDYIGAPWFEGYSDAKEDDRIIGVGNSGFSLRNIGSVIKILNVLYYCDRKGLNISRGAAMRAFIKFHYWRVLNLVKYYHWEEDYLFCTLVPEDFPDFKIAPAAEALQFSFEVNAEVLFIRNSNKLPFGCHAWFTYNLNFWKPYIEKQGYKIN